MLHLALFLLVALLATSAAGALAGLIVQAVDRGEPVHWTPRFLSVAARETMARAVFTAGRPLARIPPDRALTRSTTHVPVLLVHDPRWSRITMSGLEVFLRHRAWTAWALSFSRGPRTLAERAEELEKMLLGLKRATGVERVDVVAHGTGGLVAAWLLRHRGGDLHVRRLVTLGTPWHGTRMAVFFGGPAALETLPGAVHLDGLLPSPVPTLSVWDPDDPVVVPAGSARADEADSVQVEGAGHMGLLLSARAYRAVQAALEHPFSEGAP